MYLKVYEGVVSGSLGGHSDGYPETKHILFKNLRALAADPERKDQKIYRLVEVESSFNSVLEEERNFANFEKQRAEKERLYQKLKRELGHE